MSMYLVTGVVKRFPGKLGWYYVELDDELAEKFRDRIKTIWPKLLAANFTVNQTHWSSSIMPIKDGPLFIALPAKIRKAEKLELGQTVTIEFSIKSQV
ncbi:hypothetical protein CSA80_02980 [Candidatus Saccharibacteria bacterium]|nr:MAG: hypothetical protein CSA80_02980 [Candidatus Saccharibacteria bacterium]